MSIELIVLFFLVAFVYSSVGFGGGSSYLALLALFGIDYTSLRSIALLCNITVVSGSVFIYWRQGLLKLKQMAPILILSIPFAFLGGLTRISEPVFFTILGFTLIFAALAMFFQGKLNAAKMQLKNHIALNRGIGGSIGYLSGLVGIGGGIFLSPLLHLLKWDRPIIIASTASTYILFNSVSGLAGQLSVLRLSELNFPLVISLMAAVFIGGQLGVRIGIFKFNVLKLRRITALLVFLVGIRILLKYLI